MHEKGDEHLLGHWGDGRVDAASSIVDEEVRDPVLDLLVDPAPVHSGSSLVGWLGAAEKGGQRSPAALEYPDSRPRRKMMIQRSILTSWTLPLVALLLVAPSVAIEAQEEKEAKPVYDEAADASLDIANALARAKKDNKRVIVVYGGNWCGWCIKLDRVFKKGAVGRTVRYEYEVVKVDIGHFDKNLEIVEKYGADLKKNGVPFLTVLSGDGKVIANQNTGDLEEGPAHDSEKVNAFLQSKKATPQDAEKQLASALAEAKLDGRKVLVHLGAPW
ncbi:MAG TPA: thioredoxin family protein [Planctomycetes bacterium]|nr:thioredoxin family protein [Planctomycetota bacterium]